MKARWQAALARLARGVLARQDGRGTVLFVLGVAPTLLVLWLAQCSALIGWAGQGAFHRPALLAVHVALSLLLLWLMGVARIGWRNRSQPAPAWLVPATLLPTLLGGAVLAVVYGPTDTPLSMIVMVQLVLARAVFRWAQVRPAAVAALGMLMLGLVVDWVVPVSSALLTAPIYAGTPMSGWWVGWTRTLYAVAWGPYLVMMLFYAEVFHRRQRELETLGRTDALTGLLNRRAFMERLGREAHRQARSGRPMALLMFDIDHFKHVNDRHGHPMGDVVLATFGRILLEGTREHVDAAARWGGEEFVLMLPETDLAGGRQVALKLCAALRQHRFVAGAQAFQVTASAGVAEVVQGRTDAALSLADTRLYEAKRAGRDRVVAERTEAVRPGTTGGTGRG